MYKIREWLYIGKFSQTRNLSLLKNAGITAMLQLADHVPQEDIETLYVDINDGESIPLDLLQDGLNFICEQKSQGKRVLVACGAGISRSSTFALASLIEIEKRPLFDAYREVYTLYRGAEPHPELIMSLSAYYGKEMDLLEAWEGLHDVRHAVRGSARNS